MPSRAASLKIASNGNLISHLIYRTNDGKKSEAVPAIKTLSTQLNFPILTDYEDVFIYETITLLNPNSTPASIEIIALDRNGDEIDRTIDRSLVSWESKTISLIDIFGPETLKDLSTVRIISNTNIAGIQFVDYPGNDLVGLSALTAYSKGWLFPIATEGGNQALWTRVGIINPGNETADIHVEAFDASNNSLGVIDRHSLLPGAIYFTDTKNSNADGGAIPLNTAYVKVTADRPVSGYEVVGIVNGSGLSAVMGISEEDLTTVGFEIRGSSNGEMLNAYSMVRMEDGSVKSMAGSLGDEEWQIQLESNTFITSDLQRGKPPYTSNDLISASSSGSCGTPPQVLRKVRPGAKIIYLNPSNEDKPICFKSGCSGKRECDQMRQIAEKLADILYDSGYTVIIDYDQFDAGCRANKENPKPDVFVTLHSNATTGGCYAQASGPETYWEESQDEPLARNIQGKLVDLLKQNGYTGTANQNKIIYWRTKAYPSGAIFKGNINVGDSVKVTALGNGYRIRDNPCGNNIGNLRADDIGVVKEGPRRDCRLNDGLCYTWWKIDWQRSDQKDGWSVDFEHYGGNGGLVLEKIPHTNINPAWPNWYIVSERKLTFYKSARAIFCLPIDNFKI